MAEARTNPLILIADDEPNLRKIICLFLKRAGYGTVEARNGEEALELARHRLPDLVLMDVNMPGLDGFKSCRQIKESSDLRHIPVVICSANNRSEDMIEAIRAGAEDYVLKPFSRDTVLQKVRAGLDEKSSKTGTRMRRETDRRDSHRKRARWSISWGGQSEGGLAASYKTKVTDISIRGLSFEFVRCDVCTGYEQGAVHPLCLFAKHAKRFQESQELEFVLSIRKDIVLEVRGRIAHVYQWEDRPTTEKVGVMFTRVEPETSQIIRKYLEGKLEV